MLAFNAKQAERIPLNDDFKKAVKIQLETDAKQIIEGSKGVAQGYIQDAYNKVLLLEARPRYYALCPDKAQQLEGEVLDLIDQARGAIPDAVARADAMISSGYVDTLIFINLDYVRGNVGGYGLGVGFRKKAENYRRVAGAPTTTTLRNGVRVDTYKMLGDVNKRYIEIHLWKPQDLNADIPEFQYLTPNSKLMISGHGWYETGDIQTDAQGRNPARQTYNHAIADIAAFLARNIKDHTPYQFDSPTKTIKTSLFCCCSAGLDAGGNVTQNAAGELRGEHGRVDLKNTMAGRLMTRLKNAEPGFPVYAVVKARTTPVASVKCDIRTKPKKSGGLVTHGTHQTHRGQDFVPSNVKALFEGGADAHPYITGYGFQGKTSRMPGYKRKFKWNPTGTAMVVTDVADNSVVDPLFEIQKDRVIQYLIGTAFHVQNRDSDAAYGEVKRGGLLDYATTVEQAEDLPAILVALNQAALDPFVNRHMTVANNKFTKWLYNTNKATRTRQIIDWLINSLTTHPNKLLPSPNWSKRYLGR